MIKMKLRNEKRISDIVKKNLQIQMDGVLVKRSFFIIGVEHQPEWATCTKKSRDLIKQHGKNKAQKRKKHIKFSNKLCQIVASIHNTIKRAINKSGKIS